MAIKTGRVVVQFGPIFAHIRPWSGRSGVAHRNDKSCAGKKLVPHLALIADGPRPRLAAVRRSARLPRASWLPGRGVGDDERVAVAHRLPMPTAQVEASVLARKPRWRLALLNRSRTEGAGGEGRGAPIGRACSLGVGHRRPPGPPRRVLFDSEGIGPQTGWAPELRPGRPRTSVGLGAALTPATSSCGTPCAPRPPPTW